MVLHSIGHAVRKPSTHAPTTRRKGIGGNALRAAVLGGNDGIVSNLSLVMGVAGAQLDSHFILVTGLAGLIAGACAMAMGEWLSVQSSRELHAHQIALEGREIETHHDRQQRRLADIYTRKGLPSDLANSVAMYLMRDKSNALDTLVREFEGVDPKELGGSAWEASALSFTMFASGAFVPVSAYLFLGGIAAMVVSLVLSTLALFITGAAITVATGGNPLLSGVRQVLFGTLAALLTYGIGRLIGVAIAG